MVVVLVSLTLLLNSVDLSFKNTLVPILPNPATSRFPVISASPPPSVAKSTIKSPVIVTSPTNSDSPLTYNASVVSLPKSIFCFAVKVYVTDLTYAHD